jgi:hypothetical protein
VVEQPIRNRQVVGSTPTLGSIYLLWNQPLVSPSHPVLYYSRCMIGADYVGNARNPLISADTEKFLNAKLEWAERHIDHLQDAWNTFRQDAYRVDSEDDPNTGDRTYYLTKAEPVDQDFSLIIGDAVHGLRSALDHLAYHVMSISPGVTEKMLRNVYFPIGEDPKEYASKRARIKEMRQDAIEEIDRIEPYEGGGGKILWHLHSIDIIDKHKLLIAVGSTNRFHSMSPSRVAELKRNFLGIDFPTPTPAQDAVLFQIESRTKIFSLKTGDKLAVVPKDEVNRHMNFPVEIAFGEPEVLKGQPVIETLLKMAETIRGIIRTFIRKQWTDRC